MIKFLNWRRGYIEGHKYLGHQYNGIVYQLWRYFILNNEYGLGFKIKKYLLMSKSGEDEGTIKIF